MQSKASESTSVEESKRTSLNVTGNWRQSGRKKMRLNASFDV
jgi:hypothetical protein